jgi:hypothetical protein
MPCRGPVFETQGQSLVACGDFANLQSGGVVVHGLGSMHEFFGT